MTKQPNGELLGLTEAEVKELQLKFGKNEISSTKKEGFFYKVLEVLREPMFILLLVAAIVYFILGEPRDGMIMLIFVVGIISIDVIQEWKTDKTLKALKELSAPHISVIREGQEKLINSVELVPGDLMLLAEGVKIPADGRIIKANDLCVDESSLTGESVGVWKTTETGTGAASGDYWKKNICYAGTLVTQGTAVVEVEKTGAGTEYGKIGLSVAAAPAGKTPLQTQTGKLTKMSAGIAAVLFALVTGITYLNVHDLAAGDRIIASILSGITLAMAMIPEEFPVILTVFLSMGAWRLAKKQSLVRKLSSVETLGAVSVLCVDKTGTITQNQMTVRELWPFECKEEELCEIMGLGCETDAYDPMEKAMLTYCESKGIGKDHLFGGTLVKEYAFTNEMKAMGHVWHHDDEYMVAAKGSAEKILNLCNLSDAQRSEADRKIHEMSGEGYRVIAVARQMMSDPAQAPALLEECSLTLLGLVGLADPPRESVREDIKNCVRAGIRVVMITGDNGLTASAIARQVGIPNCEQIITGDELNSLSDDELREKIKSVNIFSRVVPEHKMRIVKAFKENGEVVAMTGDGVNDAPALKYADIGIAMGKRGTEVSREAADLILLDDNFSTIVDTVRDGRRIYDNIRKAVGYVFTIHIPIALASLLAPLMGIAPSLLMLLPLHVVLLELVIDPTCSIVLERQPAERNIMQRPPRNPKESLFTGGMMLKSVLQGIIVFAASFGTYFFYLKNNPDSADVARTMGLAVILLSNILLVLVNSSDYENMFKSFGRQIKDKVLWAVNIGTVAGLFILVYSPINSYLKLAPLTSGQMFAAILTAVAAVLWYEIVKLVRRGKKKKNELAK